MKFSIAIFYLLIFVPFQYRKTDVVFHGNDPGYNDTSGRDDLGGDVSHGKEVTGEVN